MRDLVAAARFFHNILNDNFGNLHQGGNVATVHLLAGTALSGERNGRFLAQLAAGRQGGCSRGGRLLVIATGISINELGVRGLHQAPLHVDGNGQVLLSLLHHVTGLLLVG